MKSSVGLSVLVVTFLGLVSPVCEASFPRSLFLSNVRSNSDRVRRQAVNDVVKSADITDMFIKSSVRSRFATVRIDSHVVNREPDSQEVSFNVQIPETSFITNFTMVINGKLHVAKLYERKTAQTKYDEAKAAGHTAGQVRQQSQKPERGMDIFAVDVNVAAGAEAQFHLAYQEMIERKLGHYEQRISVQPGQIVNNLTLLATYHENENIGSFEYSLPNEGNTAAASASVQVRAKPHYRELIYQPSVGEQMMSDSSKGLAGELVIKYDVVHNKSGGTVVVKDNTFVHYFSPNGLEPMVKVILFIIDISGSMSGRKIQQVRDAMKDILARLRPTDYFNILLFDDSIQMWSSEPILSTRENIGTAQGFVLEKVHSRGGTNINDALLKGIDVLKKSFALQGDKSRLIIFLTDGEPTSGVRSTSLIRANVLEANSEKKIAIYSLGFGFNLNFKFLKALSYENGGRAVRIYEEGDAVDQLKDFYKQVENPLMTEVQMEYGDAVRVGEITQYFFENYFEGSEIVVAGKTADNITQEAMVAEVRGRSAEGAINLRVTTSSVLLLGGEEGDFTMKLWAYLRIKDLLRKMLVVRNEAEKKRLEERALKLSLDYNFVTPLTSFAITSEVQLERNLNQEGVLKREWGGLDTSHILAGHASTFDHSNCTCPQASLVLVAVAFSLLLGKLG